MQPTHPSDITVLAKWSAWQDFTATNVAAVPMSPGVYLFRGRVAEPGSAQGELVYVGRAAERRGKGVRERLRIYVTGRAPHSGLGNLALERALADPDWLREKLERVEAGEQMTVQDWAREAVAWADLEFSVATTSNGSDAGRLELETICALKAHALWNRRR